MPNNASINPLSTPWNRIISWWWHTENSVKLLVIPSPLNRMPPRYSSNDGICWPRITSVKLPPSIHSTAFWLWKKQKRALSIHPTWHWLPSKAALAIQWSGSTETWRVQGRRLGKCWKGTSKVLTKHTTCFCDTLYY